MSGFGLLDGTTKAVACAVNDNNAPAGASSNSPGSRRSTTRPRPHFSTHLGRRWLRALTCLTPVIATIDEDNGIAINWDRSIAAGGSVTLSSLLTFSPLGEQPLTVTKTADVASANGRRAGRLHDQHPEPERRRRGVSSVVDTLPAGFSYVAGSSSGLTTTDPAISGQMLTWAGPLTIAGDTTTATTLHFNVTVSSTPGMYTNNADVTGFTAGSVPATNTAPITVLAAPTPTSTATATATNTATETAVAVGTATDTGHRDRNIGRDQYEHKYGRGDEYEYGGRDEHEHGDSDSHRDGQPLRYGDGDEYGAE